MKLGIEHTITTYGRMLQDSRASLPVFKATTTKPVGCDVSPAPKGACAVVAGDILAAGLLAASIRLVSAVAEDGVPCGAIASKARGVVVPKTSMRLLCITSSFNFALPG